MINRAMLRGGDIRGSVGGAEADLDATAARALGAAWVDVLELAGGAFVLGHDMRLGGSELARAFAEGAALRGSDVVDLGLCSTDQIWFSAAVLEVPGVQVSAGEHLVNLNGFKFCSARAGLLPEKLLLQVINRAVELERSWREPARQRPTAPIVVGRVESDDTLEDYAEHLRNNIDLVGLQELTVVVDAGNGMAARTVPAVLEGLRVTVVGLHERLDGTFPFRSPNALERMSQETARAAVQEHSADLALVFDGDAGRCAVLDETGELMSTSAVATVVATEVLRRHPGGTIVVDPLTEAALGHVVEGLGGQLVVAPTGRRALREAMERVGGVFAADHTGHFLFSDFYGADSAMFCALHVLAAVGRGAAPLSALASAQHRFLTSGELNLVADDPQRVLAAVGEGFRGHLLNGERPDELLMRGRAGERGEWWASISPRAHEDWLRLTVEAEDQAVMEAIRDDVCWFVSQLEPVAAVA
ncbi:phosphomannomutase/phosphoglucomutase [Luteococcus sp. Sow4_B9]|uniref:phosphomannomutase/phosphoglucomutase n=1 Tax=Luteococcus sp. Sow4_B9 TaxID=3438792 RepID=UPI003F988653